MISLSIQAKIYSNSAYHQPAKFLDLLMLFVDLAPSQFVDQHIINKLKSAHEQFVNLA